MGALQRKHEKAIKAGFTVGGIVFHADDISQQRILGAALAVIRNPRLTIKWKSIDGAFVTLDAEAVLAAADAVRSHVQACFDREAELLAALDAGAAIDPEAGWPE